MLAAKVLNLQGIPYQVGLMEASMPAMMTTLSFAIKYDLDAELAASIILISLLASTVTVPLILKLF
jgi:predicted permease